MWPKVLAAEIFKRPKIRDDSSNCDDFLAQRIAVMISTTFHKFSASLGLKKHEFEKFFASVLKNLFREGLYFHFFAILAHKLSSHRLFLVLFSWRGLFSYASFLTLSNIDWWGRKKK